eukprot:CAMPEP_0170513182 /NCGR_PEP_ID=MMETSP0208-20121228/67261_1 /TAXON_ID=197538 /ORGANISM="Strombidium inclinatum, Strain S3" /LENGTH=75 /DNA_ID=CAMNT_0010796893 /DNA_START=3017 /DNA_END=3244 /DNA_ORIENTATION=-
MALLTPPKSREIKIESDGSEGEKHEAPTKPLEEEDQLESIDSPPRKISEKPSGELFQISQAPVREISCLDDFQRP